MPIESVYIAREKDGLMLVASMEHGSSTPSQQMGLYRNQAKHILKRLSPRSAAKMSIDSDPFIFHYMISDGICYLTLTDKSYPKRLAFLFLQEICKDFEPDLKEEYGEDWLRKVETVGRQYAFIKFDRVIQRKRREYLDPNSSVNMKKLNDDLQSIHNIMRKTIDDVLGRGDKLDDTSQMSKSLVEDSKNYRWGAKKLSTVALIKQNLPLVVVAGIVIIVLILRVTLY